MGQQREISSKLQELGQRLKEFRETHAPPMLGLDV